MLPQLQMLANTTDVTTGLDPIYINMGSVGAVVVTATFLLQRVVKPLASRFPTPLGLIPTQYYLIPIAFGLTFVANRYLLTLPGDNLARLFRDTLFAVLGSPGFYTLPESLKPISGTKTQGILLKRDDAPTVQQVADDPSPEKGAPPPGGPNKPFSLLLLVLLPAFFLIGCAAAGSSDAFYKGMEAQWPPVKQTYDRLVSTDPTLSPIERSIELDSARNIDRLLEAERARRAATQPANALMPAPKGPWGL